MFQAVSSPLLRNEWLSKLHYNILQYLQVAAGWQSDPHVRLRQRGDTEPQMLHIKVLTAEVMTVLTMLLSKKENLILSSIYLKNILSF